MKTLLDNIVMNNAYCEVTDCRDIESCEKCVELILAEHDKQIRADAIEEVLPLIKDIRGLCRDDVLKDLIEKVEQLKEQTDSIK